jgi:O-succinylhomoserine sulfhydrylase
MSAILLVAMGLLKGGDHVICSQSMFGSTIKLLGTELRFGVETTFVSQTDVGEWRPRCAPTPACCLPRRPPTR